MFLPSAPVSSGQASLLDVGLIQALTQISRYSIKTTASLIYLSFYHAAQPPFCHTSLLPSFYFPSFVFSPLNFHPTRMFSSNFLFSNGFFFFFLLRFFFIFPFPNFQSTFSTLPMIFSSKMGKMASSSRTSSNTTPQSNSSLTFLK